MDFCRCQRVREHKTRTRAIAATCLVSMLPIGVGGTTESSDAFGGAAPNRSASILFFSVRSYSNSTAKSVTCSKGLYLGVPPNRGGDRGFCPWVRGRFFLEEEWLEGSNHSTSIAKQSPANSAMAMSSIRSLPTNIEKLVIQILQRQRALARLRLVRGHVAKRCAARARCGHKDYARSTTHRPRSALRRPASSRSLSRRRAFSL
jgi:hypothetical protein